MDRRTFLALLALPAVGQVLAACGSSRSKSPGTNPGTGPAPGKVSSLKGTAPRVSGGDPASAAKVINDLAADMYQRLLAVDPKANLVFSPASIAIALAMTTAGAKGDTLTTMDSVLHISDAAAIHHSMNSLAKLLDSVDKTRDNSTTGGTGTSSVQLDVVNSLWGQAGLTFQKAFLDLLSSEYGAGMELVDYQSNPEAARAAINAWVKQATHDRIAELLQRGVITTDSRLTLVNAVYLKANWDEQFKPAQTKKEAFTTGGGSSVQVDMMHRKGEMAYAKGDGWQAVDLPYVFDDLSMLVAVGDTAASAIPSSSDVAAGLGKSIVTLGFPRFDIETATSLSKLLQQMGMGIAFGAQADFSGMTKEMQFVISDVVHQANITVNEEGTEAAAATAVVMAGTAAPSGPPVTLTIDRPFTFWLRERSTGAIVFMGRVNDPSQKRG